MAFTIYIIIGLGFAILRKYLVKHAPESARADELEKRLESHVEKSYIEPLIMVIITVLWLPLILLVIVRKIRRKGD